MAMFVPAPALGSPETRQHERESKRAEHEADHRAEIAGDERAGEDD